MISSLSKLVDRAFIVGFVVPTILALLSAAALFPEAAWLKPFREALAPDSTKKIDELAFFVVTVWVLAILLSMTNYAQYRILEGYVWPFNAKRFKDRELARYEAQMKSYKDLATAPPRETVAAAKTRLASASKLERAIRAAFPWDRSRLMPTSFGNVIRAFELYAYDVYRVQPIGAWLRLGAVIPKGFLGAVNDARSNVDFLVNICFIAFVFAVMAVARALIGGLDHDTGTALTSLDLCVAFAGIAYLAYHAAVNQVGTWGDLVKSAYDCFLPALSKTLGYEVPASPGDRAEFWRAFGQLTVYADVTLLQEWVDAHPPPPKPVTYCLVPAKATAAGDGTSNGAGDTSADDAEDDEED